jgi:uncharacterized protein (TIGR02145 family)
MDLIWQGNRLLVPNSGLYLWSELPSITMTDYDGNIYQTTTIGSQIWTTSNLKTTKYADGTPIPNLALDGNTNLIPLSSWVNEVIPNDWDTFVPDGMNITSAISDGLNEARARAYTIDITEYGYFYVSLNLSLTSGSAPWLYIEDYDGNVIINQQLVNGVNEIVVNTEDIPITLTEGVVDLFINNGDSGSPQATNFSISGFTCVYKGWIDDTVGAYCWYNNDITNKADYGALYNWYAVDNAHGLAPAGWRIATNADMITLYTYLGGSAVAGGKLKEIGISHWTTPNTGATDQYGFKLLPSGLRQDDGLFSNKGVLTHLWTDTAFGVGTSAYDRYVYYNSVEFSSGIHNKKFGFSVRCVRDI